MKFISRRIFSALISFIIFIFTFLSLIHLYQFYSDGYRPIFSYVEFSPGKDSLYANRGKNSHWISKNNITGEVVHYNLDVNYMRTPAFKSKSNYKSHLIIDGCSFAFGEGLPNEDALPSILQQEWQDFNVYNFSFIGGSPHLSLHFYDTAEPSKFVKPSSGLYLYVFFTDHLARWHKSPMYLTWQNENTPIYNKTGTKYLYAYPLKQLEGFTFYNFFENLGIAQFAAKITNSPLDNYNFSDNELESFVGAIVDLKRRYLIDFPQGEFGFILHPIGDERTLTVRLIEALKREGITTFDPSFDFFKVIKVDGYSTHRYQLKNDGHPNKRMNQWLAEWIGNNVIRTVDQK